LLILINKILPLNGMNTKNFKINSIFHYKYMERDVRTRKPPSIARRMCLAPSICSLDVDFFDEGTTANNFAQIQKQYLLPMSLGICLSELAMQVITKSVY